MVTAQKPTVSPRLNLLARIHVCGALGVSGQEPVEYFFVSPLFYFFEMGAKLRRASADKLIRNGDVTAAVDDRGRIALAVSHSAIRELEAEHHALALWQATWDVEDGHRLKYWMYSRGSHAVKGMGAVPKGCEVVCGCEWSVRANDGRRIAQAFAKYHLEEEVQKALAV